MSVASVNKSVVAYPAYTALGEESDVTMSVAIADEPVVAIANELVVADPAMLVASVDESVVAYPANTTLDEESDVTMSVASANLSVFAADPAYTTMDDGSDHDYDLLVEATHGPHSTVSVYPPPWC